VQLFLEHSVVFEELGDHLSLLAADLGRRTFRSRSRRARKSGIVSDRAGCMQRARMWIGNESTLGFRVKHERGPSLLAVVFKVVEYRTAMRLRPAVCQLSSRAAP